MTDPTDKKILSDFYRDHGYDENGKRPEEKMIEKPFKDGENWRISFRAINGEIWYPEAKLNHENSEHKKEIKEMVEANRRLWNQQYDENTELKKQLTEAKWIIENQITPTKGTRYEAWCAWSDRKTTWIDRETQRQQEQED